MDSRHVFQPMLTIREEDSVREAVEQAMAWNRFADDMMAAAIWRIAREPTCGTPLSVPSTEPPRRRLLHIPPNATVQSPGMLVRYYVLEHTAVVDWIRFLPFNAAQAVNPDAFTL